MSRRKEASRRFPWRDAALLALVVAALGILYGRLSPGTYQDDDVDRYYMARQALSDPGLFLHRWGMPLPLLLFALPAWAAGYAGIEVTTALVTAAAAVFGLAAARRLGYPHPVLAGVFLAAQPLVFHLSWSGLAEPVAALLVAALLWAWSAGRPGPALLLAGWLPLARIDSALLTGVCLLAGWRRVTWWTRLGTLAPVLLWNALGFWQTGDPLFVLSLGSERPLMSLGPWHHIRNAIIVEGPVVLFFFLWGIVSWRRPEPGPRPPGLALLLVGAHVTELALLGWEGFPFGRSIGFLRHLVASSPAIALVAAWGALDWGGARARPWGARLALALGWPVLVAFALSHRLIGQALVVEGRDYGRAAVSAALGALGALFLWRPAPRRWPFLVAGAAAVAWTLVAVRPIPLDPERETMRQTVEQIRSWGLLDRVVHTNHPWFVFLTGRDRYDKVRTPPLSPETLESGSPGSFYLWENHYGYRTWGGVSIDRLLEDPRLKRVLELRGGTPDTFRVVVFYKER